MNNIIDKHDALNEKQWQDLSDSIKEYNDYISLQLMKIFDFDIWYEHSKSKDFPKEWYSMIRESNAHK